ncbi:hypothetical protein QAD02_010421 [Eretmocerus hayati]|uniref:Uncharacterized protein n=1 Tax=Eretmocerus hayati TaxID=131215 RepID=A0ACC2NTQ3_9HYME|nr:hypothetical protein QAD02_010421 [Eretmocerus hayati]
MITELASMLHRAISRQGISLVILSGYSWRGSANKKITPQLSVLYVSERPFFNESIANQTIPVGRDAVLSCVVENLSNFRVAWLRVDTQTILTIATFVITKNHRITATHIDRRTWYLHIKEVQVSDAGEYMCQINTDPMINQVGYLNVVVPPNILDNTTSTDVTVREGSNVTLNCKASGSPAPRITWRREGNDRIIRLSEGHEVTVFDGPSLNMVGVNRRHMSAYLCIATNGVPPTVSKRIMLNVIFPPSVRVLKEQIGAQEGQDVVLECLAEASPRPQTGWTHKGDEISDERNQSHYAEPKYKIDNSEDGIQIHTNLTIREVQASDYGTYRCSSQNDLGVTHGEVRLYRERRHKSRQRANQNIQSRTNESTAVPKPALKEKGEEGFVQKKFS